MWLLDQIAERCIREAAERGDLSGLPGEGRPLILDDEPLVPEELRAAYRMLKNAGYLPPELEARREINDLAELLSAIDDPAERARGSRRLRVLLERLRRDRDTTPLSADERYYDAIVARLQGD